MPVQIIATKLHAPPRRPALVPRPALVEKLNKGLGRGLILISAPAGFGKTTLAGEWVAGCGRPAAWISLEEADGNVARFLLYVVAALRTIAPTIGAGTMAALETSQPGAVESILVSLLNEMEALAEDFILVLDDYHVIEAAPVDDALAFILEHQPARMHLLILTREDPDLPLARLRARGQLTELRAADLRFTVDEASGFFSQTMGLALPAGSVAALEGRTEGWIAGLQMAALSLQGRQDVDGFIRSFTGSHRFVLDYLLEEVLQRQGDRVRSFLLQTCLLDSMCGPLCNAVTGREDGTEMLDALEHANLFVVPLDDHRQWYRYHHLFAEVLGAHATAAAQPGAIADLHRRASAWHEGNGRLPDAIRHALAAGDHERAAGLIETAAPPMEGTPQAPLWQGWVQALPDQQVRARPVLSAWYALVLMGSGDIEAAESRLSDAERWLAHPGAGMVIPGEQQFHALPSLIAVARAYLAQALGDSEGTMAHARRALELLPETEVVRRQQATGLLGITCWAKGDLEEAAGVFAGYNRELRAVGNVTDAIGTAFVLADIRAAQGRLREAIRTLEQMLQFTVERGGPLPPETADLYRGMSEILIEQGELEAAGRCLARIEDLGGRSALLSWTHRLRVAQALMRQARGDLAGALELLDEAERVHVRIPLPVVRPLAARKARIWIQQGRLDEARRWVRDRGLSADDEPVFLREYEHLTLARVLMAGGRDARGPRRQAAGLLERLLRASADGGRTGSMIEILVLTARLLDTDGDAPRALETLDRAVALAEPEGFVRPFADDGPSLRGMLERMAGARGGGAGPRGAFVRTLLAAIQRRSAAQAVTGRQPPAAPGAGAALPTPLLSEREIDVLRLLAGQLKGPEIARELYISLNTLRTHTKAIFGKLEVNSRLAAVRRARELHLL